MQAKRSATHTRALSELSDVRKAHHEAGSALLRMEFLLQEQENRIAYLERENAKLSQDNTRLELLLNPVE